MDRLLLIGPNFFEYMSIIKNEIEKHGYVVDYVDDRPKTGVLGKGFLRLFPKQMKFFVDRYVKKIINDYSQNKYKKVVVILGQVFNEKHIYEFKKAFTGAEFVYYAWDAVKNFNSIAKIYSLFDRSYTFDIEDSRKYTNLKFLPLFYTFTNDSNFATKENKALIFMTIKKGKMQFVNEIISNLSKFITIEKRLFLQSKLVFFFYKVADSSFKECKMNDFVYKRLSYKESLELMNRYKYVVDIPMKNQNGLTMRTFEALALNSKIITTNLSISDYRFYNSNDVFIYNSNNHDELNEFLKSNEFVECDLRNYSLSNFVEELLGK